MTSVSFAHSLSVSRSIKWDIAGIVYRPIVKHDRAVCEQAGGVFMTEVDRKCAVWIVLTVRVKERFNFLTSRSERHSIESVYTHAAMDVCSLILWCNKAVLKESYVKPPLWPITHIHTLVSSMLLLKIVELYLENV